MQSENKKSAESKGVELFGGEQAICVRLGKDEIYRWATQKHGKMDTNSLDYLKGFMKRNGYKHYVVRVKDAPLEEESYLN